MANQSDLQNGAHRSLQLLEGEGIIKTADTLTLTNLRLIAFDKDNGQSILPLDAISFLGYKKHINTSLRMMGLVLMLLGLFWAYSNSNGYGKNHENQIGVGLLILVIGVAIMVAATKNKLTFASAGGDIFVDAQQLSASDDWLQAVSQARAILIQRT